LITFDRFRDSGFGGERVLILENAIESLRAIGRGC